MEALAQLGEFIGALQRLADEASPIERARLSRDLDRRARAVLSHVTQEALFQASNEVEGTRRRSHQEIADALGMSRYRVSNAITDYRSWVASLDPAG